MPSVDEIIERVRARNLKRKLNAEDDVSISTDVRLVQLASSTSTCALYTFLTTGIVQQPGKWVQIM